MVVSLVFGAVALVVVEEVDGGGGSVRGSDGGGWLSIADDEGDEKREFSCVDGDCNNG